MPPRPPCTAGYQGAAALGMTGKAPGAPCKRCRAGSIPAFPTGSEGDGNPIALGAENRKQAGSLPAGPTVHCFLMAKAAVFKRRKHDR
jgi:hypothetical protein